MSPDTLSLTLVRHGQSQWNLDNRFTGWVDVPLTATGVEEARHAGRKLKEAGIGFDAVHTSLLKRAIHTAQHIVDQLDLDWLPVHRHWRLNERFYGGLTGLDKKETAAKHGDEQVFIWRRSYDIPPPVLDRSSEFHPLHDARYADLAPDLIPDTESLKTTVERVLPYWYDVLVPALRAGQRLLVAAHGNSLRALIKHLEGISDDTITQLEIPTGKPIVYTLSRDLKVTAKREVV